MTHDAYERCCRSAADPRRVKQRLEAAQTENERLQREVARLKKELESFDPAFFDEIEDMKYNYNLEVKKNVVLEERLQEVCERFNVDVPSVSVG